MEQQKMERGLKPRHVEMIALGGTIGVGLFMGSANTIQMAGPSVLLCYAVTGVVMFFIMRIMGEMLYQEPVTGSFATYGQKYISPFVGYLTACSYWFLWVVVGLSEITAVGIYVHYWFPLLPQWISALAGMAIVAAANMAAVKYYGEFEFWFALIKVVTIIVMLIVGAAVILFGFGNGGVPVGISNLWVNGGFMPNGWGGMLAAMCVVAASFQGVELIGITAGEAQDPKHTLKKAVNNIVWRILIFYIGSIFIILCIYPWNEVSYIGSPFVMTFAKVGISAAAGIINFVVLTAALSGCNSGMYSSGRMLYTLAQNGQAPKIFANCHRPACRATVLPSPSLSWLSASSSTISFRTPNCSSIYTVPPFFRVWSPGSSWPMPRKISAKPGDRKSWRNILSNRRSILIPITSASFS